MRKKIILKRIFHRDKSRLALLFDYDKNLVGLVRSINGIRWSQSNNCWYSNDDEKALKQVLYVFRELADIDISAISSGGREKLTAPTPVLQIEKEAESSTPEIIPAKKSPDEYLPPSVIKQKKSPEFAPVIFTISETDGRLIIKFAGRYDPGWIDEIKTFGKPWFDNVTHEWHLMWTQLAVDSLSDYFYSRGVEVIVKKKEVPIVISEIRNEQGSEVRTRIIGEAAAAGIEKVRSNLEEKRYSKRTIKSYLAGMELFFKYYNNSDPNEINEEDISEFIEDHILNSEEAKTEQSIAKGIFEGGDYGNIFCHKEQ